MSYHVQLFDAFTGVNPREKSAIVEFLMSNSCNPSRSHINSALDYALKNKPSFGGFILCMYSPDNALIGIVVANKTGMEGYSPGFLFAYVAIDTQRQDFNDAADFLLQKALSYTDGEVAMRVEPGHPALKCFKQMGFKSKSLELHFTKNGAKATLAAV